MVSAFHLLAKPTGPICNLDCKYCFFLSKEALYPGGRFRMSEVVLESYILFFHHVDRPMRIMAGLLRQHRAPAEIMQVYAAEE